MLDSVAFTAAPDETTAPQSPVLLSIADAIRYRRPISIRYTAGDGRRSARTLHPYGLVVHSGRWYVTGADPEIGEDRTFRLDRIADARTLPGSFQPPAGLDPAERGLVASWREYGSVVRRGQGEPAAAVGADPGRGTAGR